jgi:hypothetical protein
VRPQEGQPSEDMGIAAQLIERSADMVQRGKLRWTIP